MEQLTQEASRMDQPTRNSQGGGERTGPAKDTKVTVKIPRPLYRKIQLLIEDSGFNSPTDFIVFVLRDLVGEWESHGRDGEFSPEELRAIKRKLKNLGYLD